MNSTVEQKANAISTLIRTIAESTLLFKKATWKAVLLFLAPFAGLAAISVCTYFTIKYFTYVQKASQDKMLAVNMDKRLVSNHILDSLNNVLKDKLDADRVMTAEFHDELLNTGGLDCLFFSERHEVVNTARNIPYITLHKAYEDRSTADYPIVYYLRNNGFLIGDLNTFRNVDKKYANRIEEENMAYCGVIYMKMPNKKPLLMLSVSWAVGNEKYIPEDRVIRDALLSFGPQEAAQLMFNETK